MPKKKKRKERRKQEYPIGPFGNSYFHPPYGDFPNRRKRRHRY